MPDTSQLPAPLSPQALAVLHHPDRSAWAIVLELTLASPVDVAAQVERVHRVAPLVGARLTERGWEPGTPPEVAEVHGPPLLQPRLLEPFWLHAEPPLRVAAGENGTRIVLIGHHAAFDGLGLVAVAAALLGDDTDASDLVARPVFRGENGGPPWSRLAELVHPADVVAPSSGSAGEVLVSRRVAVGGPAVTARAAAACVAAVGAHNRRRRSRWQRVGLSVAVGGPPGIGNVASYRRVDIGADADVAGAVERVLAKASEPVEFRGGPTVPLWAAGVARRLSDSLLVSNLGRQTVPGVTELVFYPVARGRSAVAFGLAGLAGGPSTISLRSLYLSADDAGALLDDVVCRLG